MPLYISKFLLYLDQVFHFACAFFYARRVPVCNFSSDLKHLFHYVWAIFMTDLFLCLQFFPRSKATATSLFARAHSFCSPIAPHSALHLVVPFLSRVARWTEGRLKKEIIIAAGTRFPEIGRPCDRPNVWPARC